jgi:hypothetical protein
MSLPPEVSDHPQSLGEVTLSNLVFAVLSLTNLEETRA